MTGTPDSSRISALSWRLARCFEPPSRQTAEIDDELDARRLRRGAEVTRTLLVALGERIVRGATTHRVDEVVGDGDALEGRLETFVLEHVGLGDLSAGCLQILRLLGRAGDGANRFSPRSSSSSVSFRPM